MGSICKIATMTLEVAEEVVQDSQAILAKTEATNSSVIAFNEMQRAIVELQKLFKAPQISDGYSKDFVCSVFSLTQELSTNVMLILPTDLRKLACTLARVVPSTLFILLFT